MSEVTFRPIESSDDELLYRIFAGTREAEMAMVPWDDAQKEQFLRMQHRAQHTDYSTNYPDARFDMILRGDEPVGRLYVQERVEELRIIDIAILPEFRNRGIGTPILKDLQQQAAALGKPLTISVERQNPAKRLYDRLGFRVVGEGDVYLLMEWKHGDANGP